MKSIDLTVACLAAFVLMTFLIPQINSSYVTYFVGDPLLDLSLPLIAINHELPKQVIVPQVQVESPYIGNVTIDRPKLTHNKSGSLIPIVNESLPEILLDDTLQYISSLKFWYNVSNVSGYGTATIATNSFNYTLIIQFFLGEPLLLVPINISCTISNVAIDKDDPSILTTVNDLLQGSEGEYIIIYFNSFYQSIVDNLTNSLTTDYPVLTNYTYENKFWATFNTSLSFNSITDDGVLINLDGSVIGYPGNNPLFPGFNASEGSFQMGIHYNALHDFIFYSNKEGHFDATFDSKNYTIADFSYKIGDLIEIIPELSKKYDSDTSIVLEIVTDKSCSRSPLIQLNNTSDFVNVDIFYYCHVNLENGTTIASVLIQPQFIYEIGFDLDGIVDVTTNNIETVVDPVLENFDLTDEEQAKLNNLVRNGLAGLVGTTAPGSGLIKFSNSNPRVNIQSPVIFLQDLIIANSTNDYATIYTY